MIAKEERVTVTGTKVTENNPVTCTKCNKPINTDTAKAFHVYNWHILEDICHWTCMTIKEQITYTSRTNKHFLKNRKIDIKPEK